MFVTDGTSTANKIEFCACVRKGDVVLADRNCHKSIMHAIVMTGAIPVYPASDAERVRDHRPDPARWAERRHGPREPGGQPTRTRRHDQRGAGRGDELDL